MLAQYIGTFDVPSMMVVVAIVAGAIALCFFVLARKRKQDYQMDAKKIEFAHEEQMGIIMRDREIAMAKVQQNLITSHKSEDN